MELLKMKLRATVENKRSYIKFLNCKIDLSKKIFIPRVETEFWVKKAIKSIRTTSNEQRTIKVLDIFSGSGCIGIAILKNIRNSHVDFIDIDENAIEQIKINLKLNKISPKRYSVIKSDVFEKVKGRPAPYRTCSGAGYDFIFANPPYVAKERLNEVQESVKKFEPKISWYGGRGGLRYIKKFLKEAKDHLKENGIIFIEIDPLQKEEVEKILKKENYKNFKFYKDQFKKIRWVKIYK
jgi:release factor glutamine methyltransferase